MSYHNISNSTSFLLCLGNMSYHNIGNSTSFLLCLVNMSYHNISNSTSFLLCLVNMSYHKIGNSTSFLLCLVTGLPLISDDKLSRLQVYTTFLSFHSKYMKCHAYIQGSMKNCVK